MDITHLASFYEVVQRGSFSAAADALGVSEIMAKTHKRKVMDKMGARSLPDLVRYAERLQIARARSR